MTRGPGIIKGMTGIGRTLILLGALTILVGVALLLWGRLGPPSRLPGDIVLRRGPVTFYFPFATSIVLSVVLTLLLNLFLRRR